MSEKKNKKHPAVKTHALASPTSKHTHGVRRNLLYTAQFVGGLCVGIIILVLLGASGVYVFEKKYENRIYPGISIGTISAENKTADEVVREWLDKNQTFEPLSFILQFESVAATLSAQSLSIGFDATASAQEAYSVGRSGNFFADLYSKYLAWQKGIAVTPVFQWEKEEFFETLDTLAKEIDIAPENALFEFTNGRVNAFKPAKSGRRLDTEAFTKRFTEQIATLATSHPDTSTLVFELPVIVLDPTIGNDQANSYGIKELIGRGDSYFRGSIPGRIHNVALAASRINGVMIAPGDTFSFNLNLGDISAATGYKQAYVIKSGRTVLDDGGGVCQVSTTLFRAALNAGLPIVERHAHSYRVGYYEQGGWKPGFDATVYAPSYDLKIKNDTEHHILIQAKTDTSDLHLVFELYGTKDERTVELSAARLWDPKPAPPDLVQDDPTLPAGTMKQVDWANAGIKAAFDYVVKKNGEEIFKKNFFSNYVPWQAVFLKGTGP